MAEIDFAVAAVTLADGTVVEPPLDGMTVFTGPNNAGKSVLLRELATRVSTHPGTVEPVRWVTDVKIRTEGDGPEFIAWLHERGYEARFVRRYGLNVLPGPPGHEGEPLLVDEAVHHWRSSAFGTIAHFLVADQWTGERLADQTSSSWWDPSLPPNHPAQLLWEAPDAHTRFSDLMQNAFGQPIAINRYVPQIRLQVGTTGIPDTPPPASAKLREAYEALPFLAEQGDGMRAFANLLLHTLVRPAPVIVIDEPEAFLHPPQARLLGRYLAMNVPSPCQVFVATHSADFLSGVLEGQAAASKPVALVRISRTGSTLAARTLASEDVAGILDTPLLRYSNIVSGLFHDGVVLCEAEGDCHFYAATFDTVRGADPHDNLTFLHVNGKARLAEAAHKLRTCAIPTAVVADFDLLDNTTKIREVLDLLGGRWEEVRDDVLQLQDHVRSTVVTTPASELKKTVNTIIGNPRGTAALSQQQVNDIAKALKAANGWKILKTSGLTGVSGAPHNAARRLVDYFAGLGVFLVPVGELECWVRAVPATNKSAWLSQVFDEGHHQDPSPELRDFTARITNYLTGSAPADPPPSAP
jgi:hypothetical protein